MATSQLSMIYTLYFNREESSSSSDLADRPSTASSISSQYVAISRTSASGAYKKKTMYYMKMYVK